MVHQKLFTEVMMTSASELQILDSLLLIVMLVETVVVTVCYICPTSIAFSLKTSDVAYLYWFIT